MATYLEFRQSQVAEPTPINQSSRTVGQSEKLIEINRISRSSDQAFLLLATVAATLAMTPEVFAARLGALPTVPTGMPAARTSVCASRRASATSAVISGVVGSRSGTTSPTACGGGRLDDRDRPHVIGQAERFGELCRHDARPLAGAHMGKQHDHRIRFKRRRRLGAGGAQQAVEDAAVLHVRREQAERDFADLRPGDRSRGCRAHLAPRSAGNIPPDRVAPS